MGDPLPAAALRARRGVLAPADLVRVVIGGRGAVGGRRRVAVAPLGVHQLHELRH